MIAIEYRTRLKDKQDLGGGVMAFYFERPPGFEFHAGQYIDITLINPPETDVDGSIRSFSIASSPSEKHLLIVTRIRDTAFKRVLQDLPYDTEIVLDGPYGSFTLHANSYRPAVFMAGGIGITPFLSMVRSNERKKLARDSYLFYSNPFPEEAAFLNTLQDQEKNSLNFRFVPTMTAMDESHESWSGETGSIDPEMLSKHLPSLQGPIYYLAGTPRFVADMLKMLKVAGVDEGDVRCEEFIGY